MRFLTIAAAVLDNIENFHHFRSFLLLFFRKKNHLLAGDSLVAASDITQFACRQIEEQKTVLQDAMFFRSRIGRYSE